MERAYCVHWQGAVISRLLGRVQSITLLKISPGDRLLLDCDFNRSMQHLNSNCRERDVENETKTEDLLLRCTEGIDVGSMEETRFYARHSSSF
jgi:hypothetical protein